MIGSWVCGYCGFCGHEALSDVRLFPQQYCVCVTKPPRRCDTLIAYGQIIARGRREDGACRLEAEKCACWKLPGEGHRLVPGKCDVDPDVFLGILLA